MKEDKPLVSFVLTCYNLPIGWLCECIDSIQALSLSREEREVIVVDDGSDSSPVSDLMKYGDDIVYVRKRNGGLSTARNQGLEMARGEYVQFVDGDDLLMQTPYELCLDIIRDHRDADIVLFDYTKEIGTETTITVPMQQPTSGSDYMRHNNLHGTACGYLFRRSIAGSLRFTPGIYHEDEEFTPLLILRAERVYPTAVKAYYYRTHPGSITTKTEQKHTEKRLADSFYVIRRLSEVADSLPHNDRLALERRIHQLAMDHIYQSVLQTLSLPAVNEELRKLATLGLYPLPDCNYTAKYKWFRLISSSQTGVKLLLRLLPLLKKEQ